MTEKVGPNSMEKISEPNKVDDKQVMNQNKSDQPLFSPWMLVRRTPRRK